MANLAEKADHPYIVSQTIFCGGSPVIRGTKFPVRSVVNYVLHQGISPEELIKEFSHLTKQVPAHHQASDFSVEGEAKRAS